MSVSSFFLPNRQIISAITQANPAVVTTTVDHDYETGLLVRFFFPLDVGMNLLNDEVVTITRIDATRFSIGVDTTSFDAFSPIGSVQLAQVIPVAEDADSLSQSTRNSGDIVPEL